MRTFYVRFGARRMRYAIAPAAVEHVVLGARYNGTMATHHHEIERTYEPREGAELPALDGVAGVAGVRTDQHDLEAVYFDTPGFALAAAGITVRRRAGGDDAGWHLKLPAGDGSRHEIHEPLARASQTVPKRLRDIVRLFIRDEPVVPIATLRNSRRVTHLLNGDGTVLVTVCEDSVTAHVPTPDDGVTTSWREWEAELADGPADVLDEVDGRLRQAGGSPATIPSKLVRAIGDRLPSTDRDDVDLRRGGPARHVVHRRLREQVDELKRRDPQVRADVEDSVHKMRVAMRRLRSALATFRPLLDQAVTEPVRDELRWIAGHLGEARDAEVVRDRLLAAVDAEPDGLVVGPVRRRIRSEFGTRYRHAHERSIEAMNSERYVALVDALDRLVDDPPWTAVADEPARNVLPALVKRDWKRVRRRVRAADDSPTRDERDAHLHDVRKAAKRARYTGETLAPLYGRDAAKFAKAMKRVQSSLGDQHDTVVARPLLRDLAADAARAGENAFTYGRLHAAEEARGAELEKQYRRAWKKASATKVRRRLTG